MILPLSPPPSRDPDVTSQPWQKWFAAVQALLSPVSSGGLLLWASVSKLGSNLTDLSTRNHNDLQNIQGGVPTDEQHLITQQVQILNSSQVMNWIN